MLKVYPKFNRSFRLCSCGEETSFANVHYIGLTLAPLSALWFTCKACNSTMVAKISPLDKSDRFTLLSGNGEKQKGNGIHDRIQKAV